MAAIERRKLYMQALGDGKAPPEPFAEVIRKSIGLQRVQPDLPEWVDPIRPGSFEVGIMTAAAFLDAGKIWDTYKDILRAHHDDFPIDEEELD